MSETMPKEEKKMFRVRIGCEDAQFPTLEEARAFAEKESWVQDMKAEIRTPEGKTITVKIGATP